MTKDSDIRVRRIYDPPEPDGGARLLVDRLWPRGVSRERAALDAWCKEVAPSPELRQWYDHDPARFEEFTHRYRAELQDADHADALADLRSRAAGGTMTLLTATKRDDISAAAVLRDILLAHS